jgi:hypothetical protein
MRAVLGGAVAAPGTDVAKYNLDVVPIVATACFRLTPGSWTRI